VSLADFLHGRDVRTSQGSKYWSKPAIAHVIASRVYLGELSYGKDRRYVNSRAHEPVVDLASWTAAQHPNGEQLRRARRGDYLLTGLLRCASCGYVMQGTRTSRNKRVYRCIRRHAGGVRPRPTWVFADHVEPLAERVFWSLTEDMRATSQPSSADLGHLKVTLEQAERRLAQSMTPMVQDAAGDEWASMIRERRAERDDAAEALGRARAAEASSNCVPAVKTLRATWDNLSTEDKRDLFATRFDLLALRGASVPRLCAPLASLPSICP
jgi:Recombinase zinc beta ribbon domain/Recombinase